MNLIEERPWGKYEVLLDANDVKVKKINVNPKQRLSYQLHLYVAGGDGNWKLIKF